jgi:ParB family chromosome partitioning protein
MADSTATTQLRNNFEKHARGERVASPLGLLNQDRPLLTELAVDEIEPDPDQPRKDLGDLGELKASIEQAGIIQPIIVTIVGEDRYRLLAGERRYTAARELGLPTVPAIIRSVEEHRRLELQIIENVQRKDLDALEEAQSYSRLMSEFNVTQEEVARRVGKDQSTVSRTIRVLDLPEDIRTDYAHAHKVSKSLLLEVARLDSEAEQRTLWTRVKAGEVSLLQARQMRRSGSKAAPAPAGAAETQTAAGPQERPQPSRFGFVSEDNAVQGSILFRHGNAGDRDLLKVLQAWTRDVKKRLQQEGQDRSTPMAGE